ncbi:MAG: glycosyltransferase family 4 protein [Candidatus Sigynarchaeota archaeon]
MRFLIFTTHFFPYKGGLENFVLQLAKRIVQEGYKVDIITLNTENVKMFESLYGINIIRLPFVNILENVYAVPKLNRITLNIFNSLRLINYDFVITNTRFFLTSILGLFYARIVKTRLIHIEHGNQPLWHENFLINLAGRIIDFFFGRIVFSSAWTVFGVSRACCEYARQNGAKRCSLLYNSVDTQLFNKSTNKEIRELLNHENKFLIIFVGRLIRAKGIQDLISAIHDLSNIRLLIVGDGPFKIELKKIAEKQAIDCIFLGNKNQMEIKDLLSASDLFVNPSYSEGLPTSVLEACSVGIPVVGTDVGGTREIIVDGYNGFLVKPRDISTLRQRIVMLMQDRDLREKIIHRQRALVLKKFDWDINAKKFLSEIRLSKNS